MEHTLRQTDLTRFLAELHRLERSPATIEKYCRDLTAFSRWLPPGRRVDKEAVLAYKAHLCQRHAPASVNSMLAALRSFFRFMGWEECAVEPLRLQRQVFCWKERELTRPEYRRLVEAAEARGNRRLSLLLQLLASTGIRVSEVKYITVEAAARGRAEIALKGKVRTILLPGKLCRMLLKYAKKAGVSTGQIMRARSGRPMNRKEIWAQMKALCQAAEVPPSKVFPHNLRHLFARVFYAAQRDIARLADLLGHSSIETTRIYLLSSGEEHLRGLERLGLLCHPGGP